MFVIPGGPSPSLRLVDKGAVFILKSDNSDLSMKKMF